MKKLVIAIVVLLCSFLSVNLAFAAAFSQSDLEGTWYVNSLKTGSAKSWFRCSITINSSGALSFNSYEDSFGGSTPAGSIVWTINPTTGVITETQVGSTISEHYTMAFNKTLIVGTQNQIGGSEPTLLIAQKAVSGTTYNAVDVQNKSFVSHELSVGTDNKWTYGNGTFDAAGGLTIDSETTPSGTTTPGATGVTIAVDSNGVVTLTGGPGAESLLTYRGFLSDDKKTIVGTYTDSDDEFRILIIQITEKTYTAGTLSKGTRAVHNLITGYLDLWQHYTNYVDDQGKMRMSDMVSSSTGYVAAPSYTATLYIDATGVITSSGNATFHGQASDDGTFAVITATSTISAGGAINYLYNLAVSMRSIPPNLTDFDVNGVSDILWMNTSTGSNVLWFMNADGTRASAKTLMTDLDWTVVGTGDFNGDSISDILWRQASTGKVLIWFMKTDGTRSSSKTLITDSTWTVAGTGDFSYDGVSDILWRQASTGKVTLWFMKSDGTRSSAKTLITDTSWQVAGTADFNHDDVTDILWRQASTGKVTLWFMNTDGTRSGAKTLITDTSWTVAGTGDINSDYITDILWRQASTGKVTLWFMNADGTRSGTKTLITDVNWNTAGTGDFNADGITDILWRQASTGKVTLWFMNTDGTRASYRTLITDPNWMVVGQ